MDLVCLPRRFDVTRKIWFNLCSSKSHCVREMLIKKTMNQIKFYELWGITKKGSSLKSFLSFYKYFLAERIKTWSSYEMFVLGVTHMVKSVNANNFLPQKLNIYSTYLCNIQSDSFITNSSGSTEFVRYNRGLRCYSGLICVFFVITECLL